MAVLPQYLARINIDGVWYKVLVRPSKTSRSLKLALGAPDSKLAALTDEAEYLRYEPSLKEKFLRGEVIKC